MMELYMIKSTMSMDILYEDHSINESMIAQNVQ